MYKLIIAIVFISCSSALCQNPILCGEPINCKQEKRPYGFCDGNGHLAYLCAEDPYNFDGGIYFPGYTKVLKMPNNSLPICLEFDNSGPNSVRGNICGGQVCSSGLWYLKSDFEYDMNEVVKKWKCACGWDEEDCGCTVKIGFVDVNDNQFKDPVNEEASTSIENQLINFCFDESFDIHELISGGPIDNNCEISCDNLNIYLNNTPEFTKPKNDEPDFYEGNFFVSKTICDSWDYEYWDVKVPMAVNLRNIITKKLGNLYGLIGITDYSNCYDNGVMGLDVGKLKYKDLSDDDKCTFMTLYCPELVPVEDFAIKGNENCEIIPNPSDDVINIKIYSDNYYSNKELLLFDNLGRNIKKIVVSSLSKGENMITMCNKDLSSGTYYYMINLDDSIIYCKFIIIK